MTSIRSIAGRAAVCGALLASVAGAQGPGGLQPAADEPPTRQGTRGANFLHIGPTARANAMAGAVGTSVSGPTAWYWNPAGAALTESFEHASRAFGAEKATAIAAARHPTSTLPAAIVAQRSRETRWFLDAAASNAAT